MKKPRSSRQGGGHDDLDLVERGRFDREGHRCGSSVVQTEMLAGPATRRRPSRLQGSRIYHTGYGPDGCVGCARAILGLGRGGLERPNREDRTNDSPPCRGTTLDSGGRGHSAGVAVVFVATNVRYGQTSGWPPDVSTSLPDTNVAVAMFVGMWIGCAVDARPVPQSGSMDPDAATSSRCLRATLVQLALTLSLLYFFKLPDVSRLLLVVVFPSSRRRPSASGSRSGSSSSCPGSRPERPLHARAGRQSTGQGLRGSGREPSRARPRRHRSSQGRRLGRRSGAGPAVSWGCWTISSRFFTAR